MTKYIISHKALVDTIYENPASGGNERAVQLLEAIMTAPEINDEEFKAEAKRRGYKLIKITPKPKTIKLLQCQCGRKRITRWMYPNRFRDEYSEDYIRYVCEACGITAAGDKDDRVARLNWNKMIEEKKNEASKSISD